MRIAVFLLVTFAVSWAIGAWLHSHGGIAPPFGVIGLVAYMTGPALGALAATLLFDRPRALRALGLRGASMPQVLRWLIAGWLIALALAVLATLVATTAALVLGAGGPANPVESLRPLIDEALAANPEAMAELPMPIETLIWIQLVVGVPTGIAINTVVLTFTEELGWRGYLQPRLAETGLSFWPMCVVTGAIWGVWHAPIIVMGHNYPGLPVLGPILMVIFCVLLTPYVALCGERGLAWAAGAFHGTINAVAGAAILFQATPEGWVWKGLIGLPGFGVLAAGWVLVWQWRRAHPLPPSSATQ